MLKKLFIKNIILIETAEIDFYEGLNVLSGETGSGKSAIMHALMMIAGSRSDASIIRRGTEKAIVEAVFDIKSIKGISTLLEQAGIDSDEEDELIIKREISSAGKSRSFINNQLAQNSLLKTLASPLLQIVAQHAIQDLFSLEKHREMLDLYADLKDEVVNFSISFEEEAKLKIKIDDIKTKEKERFREIEVCLMEIEEIYEASIKEGEEEELFKEYQLLASSDEIANKLEQVSRLLTGERSQILIQLQRHKSLLEELAKLDPKLEEQAVSYKNALFELQEVATSLERYQSKLDQDPIRLQKLDDRLGLITKLKKKYGSTLDEINSYLKEKENRLKELENSDELLEELENRLIEVNLKNNTLAKELTEKRKNSSLKLSLELKKHLHSLNMPSVDFEIDVIPQKRSKLGDDLIEFFLVPNVGEKRVSIKDSASGGEVSRVMLSLQAVLAGKQNISSLVFDEIDSNVGGETATNVGKKLKAIGEKSQVLCITHFPQVAQFADHHLQISKKTVEDRTYTFIARLDQSTIHQELARMRG